MILRSLFLVLLAFSVPSAAGGAGTPLPAGAPKAADRSAVASVVDGDTLELVNGTTVRLVGIQAPKLALGRPGFREWPMVAQAKRALERLVAGHDLILHPAPIPTDRWGRQLAHLERDDGVWIQGEMLRQGWARVYTFADNRQLAAPMLALEREARAAGRGIWALRWYAVIAPEQAAGRVGSFQIVEGRVVTAAAVRGRVYLNFGPDWKTDFTISIPPRVRRTMARTGADPGALTGGLVRVRGWVRSYNGPMIELTHPEQLELLRSLAANENGEGKPSPE